MSKAWFLSPVLLVLVLSGTLPGQPAAPHGFLGVAVDAGKENDRSISIRAVAPDSPAAKAGLKEGDVIVKLNGKEVKDVKEFLSEIGAQKPGAKISVGVQRDGKEQTINATLGERPAPQTGGPPLPGGGPSGVPPGLRRQAFLGVQVEALTPDLRTKRGITGDAGVAVTEVIANSPAAKAGLKQDDVIIDVDGKTIHSPDELRSAVQKAGAGKSATLKVQRGTEHKTLKASLEEAPLGLVPGFGDGRPRLDGSPLFDQFGPLQQLQRRVEALEKRLKELESRQGPVDKK